MYSEKPENAARASPTVSAGADRGRASRILAAEVADFGIDVTLVEPGG